MSVVILDGTHYGHRLCQCSHEQGRNLESERHGGLP
jgi:hypothetical protein